MAYHSEDETYSCDLCGFRNGWDESDELHGELWGCEKCGRVFCSKCFTDRHGHKQYMDMMQGNDLILCPDCWEKVRKTHGKSE